VEATASGEEEVLMGGIVVDLRKNRLIDRGVYAKVFDVEGRAYKLFLRVDGIPPKQTVAGRRSTFFAQCEAYERASLDFFLKDHVATYFGPCAVDNVIGEDGISIKEWFLLDCCYAIEILDGKETKFPTNYVESYSHLADAVRRFKNLGIDLTDSSAFNIDDPLRFKFIDFEMPVVV
jgi:hypothetical protein